MACHLIWQSSAILSSFAGINCNKGIINFISMNEEALSLTAVNKVTINSTELTDKVRFKTKKNDNKSDRCNYSRKSG